MISKHFLFPLLFVVQFLIPISAQQPTTAPTPRNTLSIQTNILNLDGYSRSPGLRVSCRVYQNFTLAFAAGTGSELAGTAPGNSSLFTSVLFFPFGSNGQEFENTYNHQDFMAGYRLFENGFFMSDFSCGVSRVNTTNLKTVIVTEGTDDYTGWPALFLNTGDTYTPVYESGRKTGVVLDLQGMLKFWKVCQAFAGFNINTAMPDVFSLRTGVGIGF